MKDFLYLFCLLFGGLLHAQPDQVSGTVVDARTGSGIARASIALAGGESGTYAAASGRFALSAALPSDTLLVSALGYRLRRIAASELGDTVWLEPVTYTLPVVDAAAEKIKEHVHSLGFQERRIRGGLVPLPGHQFARFIANPYGEEGLLAAATYQFPKGTRGWDTGGVFRVRVFARRPGMNTFHPGEDLLLETVEFGTTWKGGFLTIPLREYGIVFPPEGLFIGLEYLAPAGDVATLKTGHRPGPLLGKYTTTNGKALTFARYRDNFWSRRNLPRWREEEVPNMAFGAVVVFWR